VDRPTDPIGSPAPSVARVPEAAPPEPGAAPGPVPEPAPAEPRQRWRLTFAREPVASDDVGRAALDAWADALRASGLPVSGLEPGGTGRARLGFAAPLPAACRGDAELVDVWLLERVPAWRIREGLAGRMPAGHRWVEAEDVWLGAPALAGHVVAAVWRVELTGVVPAAGALTAAAAQLLAAAELPRTRTKGGVERPYDLRALLADIDVVAAEPGGTGLRITTRIDPALGAGRPEEVVLALAEAAGSELPIGSIVRERFVLGDPRPAPAQPPSRGGVDGRRRPSRR
jgi:predicted RNA-binding Zn ribbon-like protein